MLIIRSNGQVLIYQGSGTTLQIARVIGYSMGGRLLHQRACDRRSFDYGLSIQGISTSIEPSAVMLTWLVPASTSGVTGAASMAAAFIIIGARR